ncbi:MAG: phosphonate ABC transporter, permease protein PhnE [Spirochaetales bacterium]|nr:phosphonate ABC transporter, permease protein PhnE [Spirochaetales bacterium]
MASRKIEAVEKKAFVSGPAAAVISLIVPGLGHILIRQVSKGLLFLASMITIVGLFLWRIKLLAHREIGFINQYIRAFNRKEFFIGFVTITIIILWLWIMRDVYKRMTEKKKGGFAIFAFILMMFFTIGWQISEINPGKAIRELPDAWPPLSRILWPWEAAVTRETSELAAHAKILVGTEDEGLPPIPEVIPDKPYIVAEPNFGQLSSLDENNNIVKGTVLHLKGKGYEPDTLTQIWWADSIGNEFRPRQDGKYASVMTDKNGEFTFDLVMPYRLIPPSAAGRQVHRVTAKQVTEVGPLIPADPLKLTIELIIETIFMGMMATFFGIILSIPVSFLAARNIMSGSWITMAIYFITRTILNIIRSIEPLIWALIAVVWVGLGPFAGIVALTIHSVAALGKLYSEAIEGIDHGPIEALQATGANWLQVIMFAVVPQMIPPFVSFSIYRWDINVRMSTVIGLVGGGGIGFLLVQYIRLLDYKAAGIAVWFIALTVSILDYVSAEIRARFT